MTNVFLREELLRSLDKEALINKEAFIFGTGHIAKLYANGLRRLDKIKIEGFCVSSPSVLSFEGKKVLTIDEIIHNVERPLILVCSWQYEVYRFVSEKCRGVADVIGIDEALFSLYKDQVMKVYDLLFDDLSKETYAHIIMKRMKLEMPDDRFTHGDSYFGIPQTCRYGQETFIDCGAYVGDTVEQYIWKKPNFKKIYAFEPDVSNFNAMHLRFSRLKKEWNIEDDKIIEINAGVGSKTAEYYLDSGKGTGSVVSDSGDVKCKIVSLDDYIIDEKIDFIAADVESFEYDLIVGAKSIIRKWKPTLAISIYHNAMDMFQIAILINEIVPDYKFAVRHNTVTFDDTILFAYVDESCKWIQ